MKKIYVLFTLLLTLVAFNSNAAEECFIAGTLEGKSQWWENNPQNWVQLEKVADNVYSGVINVVKQWDDSKFAIRRTKLGQEAVEGDNFNWFGPKDNFSIEVGKKISI